MVILIALAWIGAILFVLPLVFTWRAFAGGWIPIWGNVNGNIILGLLWLFIIFPIISWLIIALCNTVVASLGGFLERMSQKYSSKDSQMPPLNPPSDL